MRLELGGNGKGKVLYCPLCARMGQRARMVEGKVLVRSSHAVLRPRLTLSFLKCSPLRSLLRLRPVSRFIKGHERLFYRLYFSPYKQVEGYICTAVASHGLTKETYLKAILGRATSTMVHEEMEEIQEVYREALWTGLS
ncbi:TPA: hypothetical protein EYP12_00395 [Candidatus Bipolaricaulota bacterium]|nr:hypothetical protein [Candidatus Bipolaricaulota bacterium]